MKIEIGDIVYIVNMLHANGVSECEVISEDTFRGRVEMFNPYYSSNRQYVCDLFVRHIKTDTVECIHSDKKQCIFTSLREANNQYIEQLQHMIESMKVTINSYNEDIERYERIIDSISFSD